MIKLQFVIPLVMVLVGLLGMTEYKEELCMRKEIVEFVMEKDFDGLTVFMEENYPDVYLGGMRDLCIRMVPVGSSLRLMNMMEMNL
jgi:hypothetical protein